MRFSNKLSTFLEPKSQYEIAQKHGPVARASAPSALIVPIIRPFWLTLPYDAAADDRQGTTDAAAKAKGKRPTYKRFFELEHPTMRNPIIKIMIDRFAIFISLLTIARRIYPPWTSDIITPRQANILP